MERKTNVRRKSRAREGKESKIYGWELIADRFLASSETDTKHRHCSFIGRD